MDQQHPFALTPPTPTADAGAGSSADTTPPRASLINESVGRMSSTFFRQQHANYVFHTYNFGTSIVLCCIQRKVYIHSDHHYRRYHSEVGVLTV